MTAADLAAALGLPHYVVRKRLSLGIRLDAPYRPRKRRDHTLQHVPDPLNAAFRAWPAHDPVARLGVRHNLTWRI